MSQGLGISLWRIFLDQLLQECVYILSVSSPLSSLVSTRHSCCNPSAALLGTQLGHLGYDREGVELRIGSIGTVDACHINFAAELTVLEIG